MRNKLSQSVIETSLAMQDKGINQGSAGNVSVRYKEGFLITPSGLAYDKLMVDDIIFVDSQGQSQGALAASSEWRMHRDIYTQYPTAGAVVHTHSNYATALSCLRKSIPAFHYMVAVAGGVDIRCSDYALFGTQALSDSMLAALKDRRACLLGTHGMICFHDGLEKALALAVEVETLAKQYWLACQAGEPVLLSDGQMAEVIERFKTYGAHSSGNSS